MKTKAFLIASFCLAMQAATALAGSDQFIGDAAIYNALATNTIRPNILLLIDNSNVTLNAAAGTKYDPSVDYCGTYGGASCTYSRYSVYKAGQQGDFSTTSVVDNPNSSLTNITCNNNNNIVRTTLQGSGSYVGSATTNYPNLKKSGGTAGCDTSGGGATYALGNFLNYTRSSSGATSDSQRKVVYDAIQTVVGGARYAVNFGAMVYGGNNSGGKVVYQVGNLTSDANFNSFLSVIPGEDANGNLTGESVLSSQTARPQAESLLDAGHYFWGQALPVSGQAAMPSPIRYSCDKNHVIIITNGLSNKDDSPKLGTIVGDRDSDGAEAVGYGNGGSHYLDDVAKYIYEHPATAGQRLVTDTILAFQADDPLVRRAADGSHGRGDYYNVANANELAAALTGLITNIMLETNTSFVAPVVPVSPENRTYSGSRVYMGFFKPISGSPWHGNLKKYAINNLNALTDRSGALACYTDNNDDARDDLDQAALPSGAVNGTFRDSASSFWSNSADGGTVEAGGAGAVLYNRPLATEPRKIYTYTGTNSNLTDASNAFSTANASAAISAAALGVADATARTALINFLHGYDVYDENGNGNTSEKRGWTSSSSTGWVLGDILHSRPLIVNYATYTFTAANEANCSTNKSIVYVGANDGMLHAIRDCDGSEAWSFIPPDMLGNLVQLTQASHSYFVDSTPSVYSYDANNDGIINTGNGDKVILMFGERRGGGSNTAPTSGSYHALDVSDPASPRLLWRISNQSSGFSELGETWSEPKLVKMRVDTGAGAVAKIVAFVGAGYDNIHEDTRFGNNLAFSDAAAVLTSDIGTGNTVSVGSTAAAALTAPKGRGVYAIEIATLSDAGVPSFTNSGGKLWGYVYGDTTVETAVPPLSSTNVLMKYSIPSEITATDSNNDGYTDTLYVGDTGGRIWKFNVGNTMVTNWRGIRLFNLNSGTASVGKKFFYKPSVVVEPGYVMLFIGSGDREHPLNRDTNLIDRMYALKDRGQTTADGRDETDLTNLTSDLIQTTSAATGASSIPGLLSALSDSYGWYISLDQHVGEKVLAAPTIFNKVGYFTTFAPNAVDSVDPCNPGNLGTSRLYAVDYKNGGSVLNYDTTNDATVTTNVFAKSTPGQVLVRSDRETTLGNGIASGIVMLITPGGGLRALIGVGGVIAGENPKKGGSVLPLYWRQK